MIPIFSSSRSGRIYGNPKHTELTLGDYPDDLKFKLPCWISAQAARQVTVYQVAGLPDSVKMDMGFQGYKITVSTILGDYGIRAIYEMLGRSPLVALDDVHDLAAYFRNLSKSIKAVDKEGVLSALGVSYIYITDVQIDPQPDKPGVYSVTLSCLSELAHDIGAIELLTEIEEGASSGGSSQGGWV